VLANKPWKLEAIVRLVLSVFACFFGGSLLATALYVAGRGADVRWKFLLISTVAFAGFGGTLALLRKGWSKDNVLPRAIVCLVFFYIGLSFGTWAESVAKRPAGTVSTGQMIVSLVCFQGAALWFMDRLLKDSAMSWKETFGFGNKWPRALLWGLMAGALFLEVGMLLQNLSVEAMKHLPVPIKPQEQPSVQTIRNAASWLESVVLGVGTILLVPVAEETLFRGILYPAIKQAGFPRLALWITSLLFAVIHNNIAALLPLFVLSLVLTFLYEYTGNLLAPIAAHAVFNALNFASIYTRG